MTVKWLVKYFLCWNRTCLYGSGIINLMMLSSVKFWVENCQQGTVTTWMMLVTRQRFHWEVVVDRYWFAYLLLIILFFCHQYHVLSSYMALHCCNCAMTFCFFIHYVPFICWIFVINFTRKLYITYTFQKYFLLISAISFKCLFMWL